MRLEICSTLPMIMTSAGENYSLDAQIKTLPASQKGTVEILLGDQ